MWSPRPDFYYCQTFGGLLMWGAPSDERMGLSFTISAGPGQRSHSRVRVTRNSSLYFTVSDWRRCQPGGPGPRIYIHQEEGGAVIPTGTVFLFVASYDSQGYGGGIRTCLHAVDFWLQLQTGCGYNISARAA
jgi:hypothetical protein